MIPMLGITGYSGSGKTTLLEKLVPALIAEGLRISVIKHSHHNAQVDKEGKDSWRMKEAGAAQVLMACDNRWALMTETPKKTMDLAYLSQQFDSNLTDLILVEGFKHEPIEKILLHRQTMDKPLNTEDEHIIALATDYPVHSTHTQLDINNTAEITAFIVCWYQQKCGTK